MIFQRINLNDPERVFMVMTANEADIAANDAAQLEMTAASVDGVKIVQPNTGELFGFVGIVDAAIANGSAGLVQVYGYRSTSKVFQTNTSIAVGVPLVPVAGQDYLSSVASSTTSSSNVTAQPIFAVLLETITDSAGSATVSRKVFIRAM